MRDRSEFSTYTRVRNGKTQTVTRSGSHGQSRTSLYRVWKGMRERCHNPNAQNYRFYGGKGIGVCDEWRHDFRVFAKWAQSTGYEPGVVELDRIDSAKGYEPSNCRWLTKADNISRARWAFPLALDKKLSQYARRNGLTRKQVLEEALIAFFD